MRDNAIQTKENRLAETMNNEPAIILSGLFFLANPMINKSNATKKEMAIISEIDTCMPMFLPKQDHSVSSALGRRQIHPASC